MIRAIIFDCFGVVLTDALQELRQELVQSNPAGAAEVTAIVAANNRGLIEPKESNERIASILGISPNEFRARIAAGEVRNVRLLDYISELHRSYKIAMLSNIAGSSLRRRFLGGELETHFDTVVASGDIGHMKPEPEAYAIVAARLDADPGECIFVDDREAFCTAATAVGMRAIVYTDFDQFRTNLTTILADTKN